MRRSRLPFPKIYTLVQKYLKDSPSFHFRQWGRPQIYNNDKTYNNDTLILTLWLYQRL